MISKQTAYDLWVAYDEIERAKRMLAELEEQRKRGDEMNLRDAFGHRRALQLGVPSGDSSHRILDLQPSLAVEIIKAHIAQKRAALTVINERAIAENAPLSPVVSPSLKRDGTLAETQTAKS